MKTRFLLFAVFLLVCSIAFSQESDNAKYIEVTGTSEITLVPDEIHYLIEIKEYWEEEFDGKSKPENYRTKVPLVGIERNLRTALRKIGIPEDAIRTQEVGDYWRERGLEFLVSKRFDITLTDFSQIDEILKVIDTKGINYMRIGELKNKEMQGIQHRTAIVSCSWFFYFSHNVTFCTKLHFNDTVTKEINLFISTLSRTSPASNNSVLSYGKHRKLLPVMNLHCSGLQNTGNNLHFPAVRQCE